MRISAVLTALLNAATLLTLVSCASVPKSSSSQTALISTPKTPHKTSGLRHLIKPGETLWRIASMYHVELEDIVLVNNIQDSSGIRAGETLLVPARKNNAPLAISNFSTGSRDNADNSFIWPAQGKIIAYFRQRTGGVANKGIDILASSQKDILAACDGRVTFQGRVAGYGSTIIIAHADNISTVTCGNISSSVKEGDEVRQGMTIAKAEPSSGTRLHFEVRKKHKPQNPLFFLTP